MQITLQTFTENDFDRLIGWISSERELVQFAGPLFTYPLAKEQLDTYLSNQQLKPKKIVVKETNEVIGHCELNFSYDLPCLSRILIGDKNYRGRGLGKQIINAMINEILKIKNTPIVELRVFEWNTNAIKLYKNQDFVIQHDKTYPFTYKENEIWTSLYMTKDLN